MPLKLRAESPWGQDRENRKQRLKAKQLKSRQYSLFLLFEDMFLAIHSHLS
jgi:hypothetical protein